MDLTQEALKKVPHSTFLEDAWPHFCFRALTCGSKPRYYRMEQKKACGVESWTYPHMLSYLPYQGQQVVTGVD